MEESFDIFLDPKDYETMYILKAKIKIGGIWNFYRNDADPSPSKVHGHNAENKRQKIDGYTGIIYEGNTQLSKLSKNQLAYLKEELKRRKFL